MSELTLEQKIDRLADRAAVANVMGKYVYFHYGNEYEKLANLFALDRDDVTAEISNWGVYKGGDSIRRLYPILHQTFLLGDGKGRLHANCITTPVIEVADDGKTAKGLWFITGAETSPNDNDELEPHWTWARYAIDFIKEADGWKIWHLHVVGLFHFPTTTTWVDYKEPHAELDWIPAELRADEPMTRDFAYGVDNVCDIYPAPPEPYATFDETFSYYDRYKKGSI